MSLLRVLFAAAFLTVAVLPMEEADAHRRRRHRSSRVSSRASRSRPPVRVVMEPTYERLDALARCESGGNPHTDTGNGFLGAFQFMQTTWSGLGLPGRPTDHPYEYQRDGARMLVLRSGWVTQFPGCSRKLGFR